jgi:hypothetical protein
VKKIRLKKIISFVIWTGLGLFVLGFLYDVTFVNVPPQDPPAEILKTYNKKAAIASYAMTIGGLIFMFGMVSSIILKLSSRRQE